MLVERKILPDQTICISFTRVIRFAFPSPHFYLYRHSLILQLSNFFASFYPFISDAECLTNLMPLPPPIKTTPEAANEMSWDCSVAQWNCFSRLAKLFHHMVLCIKQRCTSLLHPRGVRGRLQQQQAGGLQDDWRFNTHYRAGGGRKAHTYFFSVSDNRNGKTSDTCC